MMVLSSTLRTVDLFPFYWLAIQGFCMHLRGVEKTGKYLAVVLPFTGRLLMRISASMVCFLEHQHPEHA
jgi:hypothetical protein